MKTGFFPLSRWPASIAPDTDTQKRVKSEKWKAVDSMMLTKEKAQKIGCGVLKMLKRKACSKALEMLAGTKHVIEKEMFNANGKGTALASRLTGVAFHACGRLEGASPSQLLLLTMEADNSL